jgi:hypothetical protein
LIVAAVSTVAICHMSNKYVVDGRLPNSHDADYDKVVEKISKMKEQKQLLFTRMYRLSSMSFDKVLVIIELKLLLVKKTSSILYLHYSSYAWGCVYLQEVHI